MILIELVDRVNLERAVGQLPSTHKTVFVPHDIQSCRWERQMGNFIGPTRAAGAPEGKCASSRSYLRWKY